MKPSTYFSLLAEFGTAHIPITDVGKKYFGYSEPEAKRAAISNKYPFPVFRAGSNKSPWVVDAGELADYLDKCIEKAKEEFKSVRA